MIDKGKIYDHFNGDFELLECVVDEFGTVYRSSLEAIDKAIEQRDEKTLEREAHTLKGVVSNFFSHEVRQITYEIEVRGREAQFSDSQKFVDQLKLALPEMEKELKDFCHKKAS